MHMKVPTCLLEDMWLECATTMLQLYMSRDAKCVVISMLNYGNNYNGLVLMEVCFEST